MAGQFASEYKFPDEVGAPQAEPEFDIEVEDDTPPEDRNRTPLPAPLKEELERDELDQYDDTVKEKLKQMRKVWHDERREKEAAVREQQAALDFAQKVVSENKRYKELLTTGEKEFASSLKATASADLENAKRSFKEAYDAGDSEKLIEAQTALNAAQIKLVQADNFRVPALQEESFRVESIQQPEPQAVQTDPKADAWQERNQWFGMNKGMTAYALGLHEELKENGVVVGSDAYYEALDRNVRQRFPESFESNQPEPSSRPRAATVVAPATRTTGPQKIRLRASQMNLIKKLGITPEQYVREHILVEKGAKNG
jgi:hypothetical protein